MRSQAAKALPSDARPAAAPSYFPALAAALFCACALPASAEPPSFSVSTGAPLLSQRPSTGAVVGQGGNYSVPLGDGRTLWLLNNVWTGELKPGGQADVWGLADGAAALAPSTAPSAQAGALSWVSDEQGWPLPLLSGDLGEYSQVRKFWPRAGVCSGGKCRVFYSIMNNFGPGPYDYFRVGQGVALADRPEGPYAKARAGTRYSLWNDIEPAFGSAALSGEDGLVYVYGRTLTAPGEYAAQLARAPFEGLGDRAAYSYYSAGAASAPWTSDLAEAHDVLPGAPEEFSVSWNPFLGAYLAVWSEPETGSPEARLAPEPWGPWGEPFRLFTCPKEQYCFGAKEQPGFAREGGKTIFVTVERKNAPYLYEITFK